MKILDLRRFRKDKNLTQIEIAEIFGCKQNFISQIESGKKSIPADKIDLLQSKYGDISAYITQKEDIVISDVNPQKFMETGADAFTRQLMKMMNEHLIAPYAWIEERDKEIERLNRIIGILEDKIKKMEEI